jgi:leucyl-tRNA synthetase
MSSAPKAKAPAASTVAPPAANTSKRDFLIDLENAAQKRWAEEKMFETDSPYSDGTLPTPGEDFTAAAARAREERPKWMGTFPYPVSSFTS